MHSSNSTLVAHSYTGELLFAQLFFLFNNLFFAEYFLSSFCFVSTTSFVDESFRGERERVSE